MTHVPDTYVPDYGATDPAVNAARLRESFAAKAARRPRVDHNGQVLPLDQQSPEYRAHIERNAQ